MNNREFPLEGGPEAKVDQTENPRIEGTPYGVDGSGPVSAEVGIADVKICDPVSVHGLALDGSIDVQPTERERHDSKENANLGKIYPSLCVLLKEKSTSSIHWSNPRSLD
jgi:hypothetical protein